MADVDILFKIKSLAIKHVSIFHSSPLSPPVCVCVRVSPNMSDLSITSASASRSRIQTLKCSIMGSDCKDTNFTFTFTSRLTLSVTFYTVYNSADQSRFPSKVTKKRLILKLHKSAQTFQSSVKNNTGVTLKASSSAFHLTNWTPIPFSLPRGKKLSSPKLQAKLDGSGIFHFQSFIHSIQTLALCIPWMWPHVSHI